MEKQKFITQLKEQIALADMNIVCKKHFMLIEWNNYYREVYEKAHKEAMKPIYNENRGGRRILG